MTHEQLLQMCIIVTTSMDYQTKDGEDLTHALLNLQICIQEMGKRPLNKLNKLIADI